MKFKDRRKAQRIEANIAVTLSGAEAPGRTINISTNGVYFQSPHFIEPLTKVQLELMIPDQGESSEHGESITIDGVVVRVDPEKKDESLSKYQVAVFFTFVSKSAQRILNSYIRRRLSS